MKQKAYTTAGVDIDLGNQVKSMLPRLLAATRRRGVLGQVGGFGGLFALDVKKYREPVLVASVDGVGTKLKIAFAMNRHDTIGQDLVNHCVNDIAVVGAEPLFFLDYIGTGKLEPRVFREIIRGFAKACAENRCALIGGETAQMPGFYCPGEYDLSGTIVGVVEKSRMLDGQKTVRPGDAVIGLASSGLHTNGYSLARKVFFEQMKLKPASYVRELGHTIGQELLKVHLSYGPLVQKLIKSFNAVGQASSLSSSADFDPAGKARTGTMPVPHDRHDACPTILDRQDACPTIRAFAHITGGGFTDNVPRVLPSNCDVVIRKGTWDVPPIFRLVAAKGRVPEAEMYHVFNMGVGMVAIVAADRADAVLRFIRAHRRKAWLIGEVIRGRRTVRVE
jgi:phosphoribosylformylglycinamidine cyclo-ligase